MLIIFALCVIKPRTKHKIAAKQYPCFEYVFGSTRDNLIYFLYKSHLTILFGQEWDSNQNLWQQAQIHHAWRLNQWQTNHTTEG